MSETKTKWELIVSGEELAKAKVLRSKMYRREKQRRTLLPELIEEGWKECGEYKDKRFVAVKCDKKTDEKFEDRVWTLFAMMGFTEMNKDRNFIMSYDFNNPNITQQIDVFAADGETVLIVECKATDAVREGIFKKQLEAFHGQMNGLRCEVQKRYKKAKVKFIFATQNYIISQADREKMNEWGIAHFGDSVINYYYELTKHLGKCARYQLLGYLFSNQDIHNMDDKIPAIQSKMGGHKYYSFSIEPERLLKIGYVLHRNESNENILPTYQRLIKKKRLSDVQKFIKEGGYFPNSLIISIDTAGKGLQFDVSATKVEGALSQIGILHLPKKYRSAYIIDGQHRLYGYSDSEYALKNSIPVVAFVDFERKEQIKLFMDINENQKAVPKTLRVTLNADMLWESRNNNERRQALRSKIAQMFGDKVSSPLMGKVVVGEEEKSAEKCITIEAIQNALKKCDFLTAFGKKNEIVKDGTFDLGDNLATCDLLYSFLENCLQYVKQTAANEWNLGSANGSVLVINRGIQAVLRVINDIVNHLVAKGEISPKSQKLAEILKKVEFYLDPLADFLNNLMPSERKKLRGYLGGGAEVYFWRSFQREISKIRSDFNPEGMQVYWEGEARAYNANSIDFLRSVKASVKEKIKNCLVKKYGEQWERKALPKAIYILERKMKQIAKIMIIRQNMAQHWRIFLHWIALH